MLLEGIMFIEKFKNNGYDYLRLTETIRYTNEKGVRTVRKKYIYNIGPMSKYDDGLPNYHERLKESFKAGKPLIPELLPYVDKEQRPREQYDITFTQGDPDCFGKVKLYSHVLIEKILNELGLVTLINSYKRTTKYDFDFTRLCQVKCVNKSINIVKPRVKTGQNNDILRFPEPPKRPASSSHQSLPLNGGL